MNHTKSDICKAVRSVDFVGRSGLPGGKCLYRNALGFLTLGALGYEATFKVGSLLYRAGPDPVYDLVAFCGWRNCGLIVDNMLQGHCWIEAEGDLIDFTPRDWPQCEELEAIPAGFTPRPIQWTAEPLPQFIWEKAGPIRDAWQFTTSENPHAAPDLGKYWYGPLAFKIGEEDRVRAMLKSVIEHVDDIAPFVVANLQGKATFKHGIVVN